MAYFTPYIDVNGLHIPSFQDIQNYFIDQAKSIFGQDIYLGNDSQDMQYIATVSKAVYDAVQCCQLAVNNQSPQTAIGTSLDSLVKLNGLQRLPATYSVVQITCVGEPGTVIPDGIVQDTAKYKWDLPPNITIPESGVLSCTATCEVPGNVVAGIGTIQTIVNPQYGWYSVSNAAAAIPGVPTETDLELRARQSISVDLPAQTPLNATAAAIRTVDGVTRSRVYENYTNATDANGIPSHSIAPVVEGGDDQAIASTIAKAKTMGCGTYGTTQITLPSQFSVGGSTNFSRPAYSVVDVAITVALLGSEYSQDVQNQMIANVKEYLETLDIGASVQASSLFFPALTAMPSQKNPCFRIVSLTVSKGGGAAGDNIEIDWDGVAKAGEVTVTGGL